MKGTRKKQILAWGLAAGMVVSNLGTAFAAYNVGTPGASSKDEVLSVSLNGSGGTFFMTASDSDAEKLEVVDVEAKAGKQDGSSYYAEFGAFSLASGSNAERNFIKDGPNEAPENQPEAKFDGWYADLTDITTKLTDVSRIYEDVEVYARWVEPVKEIPKELEADVKDVEASGLTDVEIKTIENESAKERIQQNINKLALGTEETEYSYQLTSAPLLLDISAQLLEDSDAPGMITMKIPESLGWKKEAKDEVILVLHFENDGYRLKEKPQEAVVHEDGTMTFAVNSFSPYAIVLAKDNGDAKTATVKVENVKGGVIVAYHIDENGKMMLLPIDKEVELPQGTELKFNSRSMALKDGYITLRQNEKGRSVVNVKVNDVESEYPVYNTFTVTGDTVISADFVANKNSNEAGTQYGWSLSPSSIVDSQEYTGTIKVGGENQDGEWVPVEGIFAELAEPANEDCDNDKFTVSGNEVKSKDKLEVGEYRIALNIYKADGTQIIGWDQDGNRKEELAYGVRSIYVGVRADFDAILAEYDYDETMKDYYKYGAVDLGSVIVEKNSSFEQARNQAFEERGITDIGMYGCDTVIWKDYNDNKVDTAAIKLEKEYNDFRAYFEGYELPKVAALDEIALNLKLDGSDTMKPEDERKITVEGTDAAKIAKVDWMSYNENVAVVESSDKSGKTAVITAGEIGTAQIKATVTLTTGEICILWQNINVTEDGETVEPEFKIDINGKSSMKAGTTQTLTLTGDDVSKVKDVVWKSGDASIVKVDKNEDKTAKATAMKEGKAIITAEITVETEQGEKTIKRTMMITVTKTGSGSGSGSSGGSGATPSKKGNSYGGQTAGAAGEWTRDGRGWRLLAADGSPVTGQWSRVGGVWYYFGADGYMLTGWQFINGKWYFLTETEAGMGAMLTGWQFINGKWYFLTETEAGMGAMLTGWQFINGQWYYLTETEAGMGAMLTGWQLVNGAWYYLNPGPEGTVGAMAANTQVGDYYVGADGAWVQ